MLWLSSEPPTVSATLIRPLAYHSLRTMDLSSHSKTLVFFVNGKKIEDNDVDPEWTLLHYLRNKLRLCGTKLGCAEGGCGACTVMVSKFDRKKYAIVHLAVNACLAPVCAMHGLAVTTVEGIGSVGTSLHPVQERIAKAHGSQCGFCTPGIVMSMYTLLRSLNRKPTMEDIEITFQGNLCRCTGYRPILDGYRGFTVSENAKFLCSQGDSCCRNSQINDERKLIPNGLDITNGPENSIKGEKLIDDSYSSYDPTQEIIFPPELAISDKYDKESLLIKGKRVTCFRPVTLGELLLLKSQYPNACIINGNTEVGVEVKFKNILYQHIIIGNMIPELSVISVEEYGLKIGAGVTINDLEIFLTDLIKTKEEASCRIFVSMLHMIKYFAGKQIRNVAAIGGNIMTGSPISDLNPILMAAGAKLEFKTQDRTREITMDDKFWVGYRKNITEKNEVLISVFVPFTTKNQFFKAYKQSRRRDDDIAIVNAAFSLELDGPSVKNVRLVFGGMGPTTLTAQKTQSMLIGKEWNESLLNETLINLGLEFPLPPDAPGGMVQFRRSLTLSFFFKFYLYVCNELESSGFTSSVPQTHKSAIRDFQSLAPSSSQFYSINPSKEEYSTVGRPIVHQSAYKHATGEAIYCDDMPKFENEAYLALVTSSRAHAKILKIDCSKAFLVEGVLDFISAKDILPDRNNFGSIVHDEEIFASKEVLCVGQPIGAVIAVDQATAQRAAKLVEIEYEDLLPVVITIQEAIQQKSFFEDSPFNITRGDPARGFEDSDVILEGDLSVGGQEHFYLETHACIVNPKNEDKELEIFSSTQHPSELQSLVSHALGIPHNRIVCRVKRMGGGFGGKETRSSCIALPAAIAAHKLKRPIRIMLDRDEDMVITGHRHPFYGKYKVGCMKTGKIKSCEISLYCNAGCSKDLSDAVMERAMLHVSNTCMFENVSCYGFVCKTNLPSNTAFRGFGAPQAMLLGETMIFHIAEILGLDPEKVHSVNFYKNGDITHFKQPINNCTIELCWKECLNKSNYYKRKADISEFNRGNRFKKRGITIIPTMFGIGFSTPFLNQAGALVLVYSDGSVLLSHGGTEMGQGLHTKMIQVASRALNIPADLIHISETGTDKVPNTSATAGSASSDLNGMAIINVCNKINERLTNIKKLNPQGQWKDWIKEAYFQRISLAASGFYKTENIGLKPNAETGNIFNYFTYGVACSEVEIDCLTGDHQVLRSDIVMDLGESLNPAIDIGQIEGAFVQGYGLFTMEELVYSPKGVLFSRGPGAYKIPGFADIPAEFNVSLLKGSSNPRAVYSSKATGEPPLFLASSIFFAIREAVKAYRKDNHTEYWFTFNSPATAERIRTKCLDNIIHQVGPEPECKRPWNVII